MFNGRHSGFISLRLDDFAEEAQGIRETSEVLRLYPALTRISVYLAEFLAYAPKRV